MAHNHPILAKYEDKRNHLWFLVEGGVHKIGEQSPYFSLTATGKDHESEFGGCCHDIILQHFPQFADLAAMHLSDIDGRPMHASANGWYWLAGFYNGAGERFHGGNSSPPKTSDECLQVWANHVRVSIEDARHLAKEFAGKWNWPDTRKAHDAWIEAQAPRWKAEAKACIENHSLVVYE